MILRKRPITIALAIAGIIAGAHAGIAAINTEPTEKVADPAPVQTEATATTETPAPVEMRADAQAPATPEVGTPVAQSPAESIVQPKWQVKPAPDMERVAMREPNRDQADEYYVRIPFTNKTIKVTNPTFPRNSSEFPDTPASVVAYFDNKNANTVLVGAPSPVFPSGGDQAEPNPGIAAYFDQREASRVAATKAQQPAVSLDAQTAAAPASGQSPGT